MMNALAARDAAADVVGIGFGPSNLALAIALAERVAVDMRFLEAQPAFGWHRGMLIEGATMQVSFLKDLVTLRNPTSPYSFIAYLHEKGRLPEFINAQTHSPLRVEYHDYLEWAARDFAPVVAYDTEAVQIRPVVANDRVDLVEVVGRHRPSGDPLVLRAHNVVIAAGLRATLPAGVTESVRVCHSADLLDRVEAIAQLRPRRLAVVGAGQSAAEAIDYLYGRFPDAEVTAVFSRFGFSVADDSPFTNAIFDPESVDDLYAAPDAVRRMLMDYHSNTNYSVVDLDLSRRLHQRAYLEMVTGNRRLHIMRVSRVQSIEDSATGVRLQIGYLPTGEVRRLDADAVVFATGYVPVDPLSFLHDSLAGECKRHADGSIVLDRNYRVRVSDSVRCGIYVQGAGAESSHGLSAGLLSNVAVRAGEIAESVLAPASSEADRHG